TILPGPFFKPRSLGLPMPSQVTRSDSTRSGQGPETNPRASVSHWSEASSTHDTPRHARRRMADRISQILPRALGAHSTPNVTRNLLQCSRHVLKRWRPVGCSYALVRVASDVIRHALRDTGAVCDLFESVTPSVIGLHMRVVNSQRADPMCEPLTHLRIGW